jgi:hypothetical protein
MWRSGGIRRRDAALADATRRDAERRRDERDRRRPNRARATRARERSRGRDGARETTRSVVIFK